MVDLFLIVIIVGIVVDEIDQDLSDIVILILANHLHDHQIYGISFNATLCGVVELKSFEDAVEGVENGSYIGISRYSIFDKTYIFLSVVPFLENSNIKFAVMQPIAKLYLDVRERNLSI